MRVAALWRYPVKSLRGETAPELALEARGIAGDRVWALVNEAGFIASGKDTRRFRRVPELMLHASRLDAGLPRITLADGRTARSDEPGMAALVEAMAGPGWTLREEEATPHLDAAPVHVVTSATLAVLSERVGIPIGPERLRPNVLVDVGAEPAFAEDAWVGRVLELGAVRLRVTERTERCVMVDHVQYDLPALPPARGVLKTAGAVNGACAGVYAEVLAGDRIAVGDPVRLTG